MRGAPAHGVFQVYEDLSDLTMAGLLTDPSRQTSVFVRFSTVAGSRGSTDCARDVRGVCRVRSRHRRSEKQALVEKICVELSAHTMVEEEIFYPACRVRSKWTCSMKGTSNTTAARC
jgi:hypothetical protein